jgi:hypothetical protein
MQDLFYFSQSEEDANKNIKNWGTFFYLEFDYLLISYYDFAT